MIVEAHQNFQFYRQKTWFLENNRALSKFLYGNIHLLISIIKSFYNQSIKKKHFHINHADHLNLISDGRGKSERRLTKVFCYYYYFFYFYQKKVFSKSYFYRNRLEF